MKYAKHPGIDLEKKVLILVIQVNTCPLLVTHLTKFELKKPTSYTAREAKIAVKNPFHVKGQLISKLHFGVFKSTKKPTKFL